MANTKVSSEQIIDDVALGGNPTTTTQSASDNSTKVATTAYVTTAVANLVDSAPSSLNTLNELAAAMNDNASFFSTVLPLSGGTMTGALNMGSQNITNLGDITGTGAFVKASSGGSATSNTVLTVEDDDNTELSILGGSSSVLAINFGHSGDNDEGKITFNTTAGSEDLQLVSSKEITLDATGQIILDADTQGSGNGILLKDAGTLYGSIFRSSSHLHIKAEDQDKDLLFMGNDGGTEITALTLDMSEAGNATFNSLVGINKAVNASVGLSVGSDASSSTSYGLEVCNSSSNTRFLVDGLGSQRFYGSDNAETARFTDGKLGIGTDSPSGVLTIRKTVTGSNDQEMLTIRRDGGSTSDGARQASIAFFDGANNTYTGKISGYRDSPAGNYDGGLRFYVNPHATNANATFAELDNTPAMYLNPDRSMTTFGSIYMPNGSGISFASTTPDGANSASVGNEILDDYEEGTWTPQISDLGGNAATLSTANGSYTKIGRMVFLHYVVTLSSKGSMTGNYVFLKNIPFNHPTANYNGTGVIDYFTSLESQVSCLAWDTSSTASVFWLVGVTGTQGYSTSYISPSYFGGNETIKGTIIYQTDV